MISLSLVMLGGALGAAARYLVGQAMLGWLGSNYPWGTLAVNLIGGLAMGVLVGMLARMASGEQARLFLAVGVLGGFTTFSAFSLELVTMLERGAMLTALGYALASVIGAVLALFAGLAMTRGLA
ncbi:MULTISPECIES: fluoride efflux transporter CrcB [unclassified Sphingomonas]|uniref:fluoride efflux transporter CrcB n=1 Tax=unclassified Sphingomonas TaxID=196159 RepID=UPI000BCA8D00|nr:MAG: camphor resistance protein CrcB [Sphingomonas sp. 12-62-6]OYX37492.1 MAG: camphor resistance protein CrcB [Sphingomonas sp. 32-62-10]